MKQKTSTKLGRPTVPGERASRARRMAEFCIAVVQGAMLMGKLDRSTRPVEATAREALTHLKSYLITPAR